MEGFTILNPNRNVMAALQAKHGLKAIKLGFRTNRVASPKRCREIAEQVTGQKFKARDYDGMLVALQEYLDGESI